MTEQQNVELVESNDDEIWPTVAPVDASEEFEAGLPEPPADPEPGEYEPGTVPEAAVYDESGVIDGSAPETEEERAAREQPPHDDYHVVRRSGNSPGLYERRIAQRNGG